MQLQSHLNRIRETKVTERQWGTKVRGYWNTIPIHIRLPTAVIHLRISDCDTEIN